MLIYFIKRLSISILLIWGVLTITFILMHIAPGDPSSIYINPDIDPKVVENIQKQMGLNLPIYSQYFSWLNQFIIGNWGVSFMHKRPVNELLAETIPNTLQLTMVVFVFQFIFGILMGVVAAIKRHSKLDISINSVLVFLYSVPGFWLALMAIRIFSIELGWLPSSQMQSITIGDGYWPLLLDRMKHLILPVMVLALPFSAYTARFVRGSLSEALQQDYIRTALAYGIRRRKIIFKYALKNALLPIITLSGLYLPFLLGGAVITEYIFSWPGMGRITIEAIFAYDYPLILASTVIAAMSVIFGNFMSDFLYSVIDPRIKLRSL
jgi:peptide/nickel transport system permease protein